ARERRGYAGARGAGGAHRQPGRGSAGCDGVAGPPPSPLGSRRIQRHRFGYRARPACRRLLRASPPRIAMKLKIFAPKRLAVATCVLAVASLGAAAIVFTQ